MIDRTLGVLIVELEKQVVSRADALAGGAVKDYAEYRELVGLIRGLKLAISETRDLLRNFEDQEDE